MEERVRVITRQLGQRLIGIVWQAGGATFGSPLAVSRVGRPRIVIPLTVTEIETVSSTIHMRFNVELIVRHYLTAFA